MAKAKGKQAQEAAKRAKGIIPAVGGSIAGAATSLVTSPLVGAAVGSAVAKLLTMAEDEFASRILSDREKMRVQTVLSLTKKKVAERIDAGDHIRTDGFFRPQKGADGDSADEVVERILLVSQREPEQIKIPYMANLLTNSCFGDPLPNPNLHGAYELHAMIKLAEQLTYRQLCILCVGALNKSLLAKYRSRDGFRQLAARARRLGIPKMNSGLSASRDQFATMTELHIYNDCFELYTKGLVGFDRALLSSHDIAPKELDVHGRGYFLWKLMGLSAIPDEDLRPVIGEFSADYKFVGSR